jgi:hypothetical protein
MLAVLDWIRRCIEIAMSVTTSEKQIEFFARLITGITIPVTGIILFLLFLGRQETLRQLEIPIKTVDQQITEIFATDGIGDLFGKTVSFLFSEVWAAPILSACLISVPLIFSLGRPNAGISVTLQNRSEWWLQPRGLVLSRSAVCRALALVWLGFFVLPWVTGRTGIWASLRHPDSYTFRHSHSLSKLFPPELLPPPEVLLGVWHEEMSVFGTIFIFSCAVMAAIMARRDRVFNMMTAGIGGGFLVLATVFIGSGLVGDETDWAIRSTMYLARSRCPC